MTDAPERIVDAHVHLWDPSRADWYPFLTGQQELNMGDVSGMVRLFDAETYFSESAKWNVEKFVHVAAAAAPYAVDETMEKEVLAERTGNPAAIIGRILPTATALETANLLDRQMHSPRFRGVRPQGAGLESLEQGVFAVLEERQLVFDFMAHPDELLMMARALQKWGGLTIVVEHTGWPRVDTDEEFKLWQVGMAALAGLGEHVNCKLSGLAMPLGTMDPSVFRRWVEFCLETFGIDRCFFASNFPVDGMRGTFDELYNSYSELTRHLGRDDRQKLFATNAERVYRC